MQGNKESIYSGNKNYLKILLFCIHLIDLPQLTHLVDLLL